MSENVSRKVQLGSTDVIDYSLPTAERLNQAVAYLHDNPGETPAPTARLYGVNPDSLKKRLQRGPQSGQKRHGGGQNKILEPHQEEAVHTFIRSLLKHGLMPTTELLYGVICQMVQEDTTKSAPSYRWFQGWRKSKKLHMITTKPISSVRVTAADIADIRKWHRNYKKFLERPMLEEPTDTKPAVYGKRIKMKRVYNFDEGGFRAGCMRGIKIIVPPEVKEYYNLSSEDRRSSTIIEAVSATGGYPIPPYIIIQGKKKKPEWFHKDLPAGTMINSTESSFTNNQIGVDWLWHFIKHVGAGPNSPWFVLLMDQHSSHMTPEFTLIANQNHIRPYPFPSHLTHCMQPLDVGLFGPYKHWHQKALRRAMAELRLSYSVVDFLGDLAEIRLETFTRANIKHAWENAGMNPPNVEKTLSHVKTFSNENSKLDDILKTRDEDESALLQLGAAPQEQDGEPTLPRLPRTPTKPSHVEYGMYEWDKYLEDKCSSGHREEYKRFSHGVKRTAAEARLQSHELKLVSARRKEEVQSKTKRRRTFVKVGIEGVGLTKEDGLRRKDKQDRDRIAAQEQKEWNNHLTLWRPERDAVQAEGVAARKKERERVATINKLTKKKEPIPPELQNPIPDPWEHYIVTDPTYIKWRSIQDEKKRCREEKGKPPERDGVYNGEDGEPLFILGEGTVEEREVTESEFWNRDRIPLGPVGERQAFDDSSSRSSSDDDDTSSDDDEDRYALGM